MGRRLVEGSLVCAKGLTCETGPGGAYWIDGWLAGEAGAEPGAAGTARDAMGVWPVDAAGDRGSIVGWPHVAQNFFEPMSPAPHFAQ